jgi:regulator of sigma E protease
MIPRRTDLPLPEGGFETRWLVGVTGDIVFQPQTETPGLFLALGSAVEQLWFVLTSSLSGLAHMISGAISTCNLSGPVGIAETSAPWPRRGRRASSVSWRCSRRRWG